MSLASEPRNALQLSGHARRVVPEKNRDLVEERSDGAGRTLDTGLIVWFTGLSAAGKTTIAQRVAQVLQSRGVRVEVLDGDVLRSTLSSDLGYSRPHREEHLRRIAFVASLLARNGVVTLVALVAPFRSSREQARASWPPSLEVYVNAPLSVCEQRDPKGLYRRARRGEVQDMTGVGQVYEAPLRPDVECRTAEETVSESVARVLSAIEVLMSGPYLLSAVGVPDAHPQNL